jgi:hypothetical protein
VYAPDLGCRGFDLPVVKPHMLTHPAVPGPRGGGAETRDAIAAPQSLVADFSLNPSSFPTRASRTPSSTPGSQPLERADRIGTTT